MADPRKVISIVTPCFNEEGNILACQEAVRHLFQTTLAAYDYEHIFCDNCSTDGTVRLLRETAAKDPKVKLILNARNFGVFRSMFNGLMACSGDAVVPMLAADLQDPPEVIVDFVRLWEQGYEVIYGQRRHRTESALLRLARTAHYWLIDRLSEVAIPRGAGEFQLLDRKVVDVLAKFDDYEPYLRGMIASCGFNSTGVGYTWGIRTAGTSKTRLWDMISTSLNGLVSFAHVPIRISLLAGFALALLSLGYAFTQLVLTLILGRTAEPGVSTLIVAQFFLGGVQLFFLGMIGEYVTAIHSQVRRGPLVIERDRVNFTAMDKRSS